MYLKIAKRMILLSVALVAVQNVADGQVLPFDRDAIKIKDYVVLRSGQRLYGKVTKQGKDEKGRAFTIIKTENDSTLKLGGRLVAKTHVIDEDDKLYNSKVDVINDDPEGHWSAVTFLGKQKGSAVRYKDQIQFHLKRIMLLDPNDDKAKTKLKYEYIEDQDRWVPEELYFKNLGYYRKGTGWAPKLQDEINENGESINELLGQRKKSFAAWKKALKRKDANQSVLAKQLFSFVDAPAVTLVFKEAKKEANSEVRRLYIEAFGRVGTGAAAQALVYFSVEDPVHADRALDLLAQPHFDDEYAASHLSRYFDPKKYPKEAIRRAAFNIGELNAEGAILALVNVLKTKHVVQPGGDAGRE